MSTDALKTMKDQLMSCIQGQFGDLQKVDTHELGQAIDMVKDLSQAIYYCTITESMENSDKEEQKRTNVNYYTVPSTTHYYTTPMDMPIRQSRNPKQGKSPMRRRMYMEGKESHNDPSSQIQELQAYLQELSSDITEMIKDSSPEEKMVLRQKMTTLANKIS